jgi:hypothetical protein
LGVAGSATAQESRSSALAKQFTDALGGANLMAIAAKDASQPDVYVAAMSVPGMLLVVSSKFSVPAALDDKLLKKDYQDVYLDLQSASDAATKMFIQDVNADGLKFKTFDVVDTAAGSRTFDGDWKKAKAASEQAYQKSFADTDEQYAKMLSLLLAALKKP